MTEKIFLLFFMFSASFAVAAGPLLPVSAERSGCIGIFKLHSFKCSAVSEGSAVRMNIKNKWYVKAGIYSVSEIKANRQFASIAGSAFYETVFGYEHWNNNTAIDLDFGLRLIKIGKSSNNNQAMLRIGIQPNFTIMRGRNINLCFGIPLSCAFNVSGCHISGGLSLSFNKAGSFGGKK